MALLTSDFLGSTTINLLMGDAEKPIQNGDTLIGQLDKGLAEVLQESAVTMGDNVQGTIRRINAILDSLADSSGDLKATLSNARQISTDFKEVLSENKEKFKDFGSKTNDLIAAIKEIVTSVKPILTKFDQMADTLNNLQLSKSLAKANTILDQLNLALEKLNQGDGSLGKLLNDDSLYINLNQTVLDLDKLLLHLDDDPKHFFAPLGKKKKKKKKKE